MAKVNDPPAARAAVRELFEGDSFRDEGRRRSVLAAFEESAPSTTALKSVECSRAACEIVVLSESDNPQNVMGLARALSQAGFDGKLIEYEYRHDNDGQLEVAAYAEN